MTHWKRAATFTAAAIIATFGLLAGPTAIGSAAPSELPIQQVAAPTTGQLRANLATAVDISLPRSVRGAALEAGEAGLGQVDTVAGLLAAAPPSFRWDITGPVNVNGDTATATLFTATDGYDPWTTQLTWREIDGQWKLSREGQCALGQFLALPC
ncbi:hypothetical protein JGU71_07375 [Antrihabitans sp. YC3-6]|uniref:Low molecular weight antigen MTB12-like C-terminal domain-containing protein n=1 Tax=Antrihabitans stalagmiti TaxID=2799499 RepID=A0A934U2C8_9NOCA|nr:hypothetical protein [Antrihabitans stalagmiti]MBJ8338702.1 hypothetical protein [Antrihabitans stalagmiti]